MSQISEFRTGFVFFPDWAALRVVGPDAASWLNGLVTCDVLAVRPDRGAWGTLLTKQGKIAAELQIVGKPDELFVAVSGGDAESTLKVLDGYLVMEDAEIERSDVKWVVADEKGQKSLRQAGLTLASLPWTDATIHAAWGPGAQMEALASSVPEHILRSDEWHDWMLLHGVPRFGTDYDERDNLHAASLERRTVDWQKGCYLGQEVVCMQDMRGKVKKRLVLLRAEDAAIHAGVSVTTSSGEEVGRVTSSSGAVAIASLNAPHFEKGTDLRVGGVPVCVEPLRA